MQYYFDLTSSAYWSGTPVGIIRVERELARRCRQYLGKTTRFCFYNKDAEHFFLLKDDVAAKIINGELTLVTEGFLWQDFSRDLAPDDLAKTLLFLLEMFPSFVLKSPTLFRRAYRLAQRARLLKKRTRVEIEHLRCLALYESHAPAIEEAAARIPLPAAIDGIVELDRSSCIISGGLDWDHKNQRVIAALKKKYAFNYVAIIYDMIPIFYPHYLVPGYVDLLADYFGELIWVADKFMCISKTTQKDFERYLQNLDLPPRISYVFPLGGTICSDRRDIAKKKTNLLPPSLIGKRFALCVGTIEPRKNHRTLYEAWDYCIRTKKVDSESHRLVFVGRRGWSVEELLLEIATNPATKNSIILLHDASDELLKSLYHQCAFTLFPSHYEGYGLPVAESLAYGKVCIASDIGALDEIVHDLVPRIKSKDTMAWSDIISRFMNSNEEIEILEKVISEQYTQTTWDDSASIFFRAIRNEQQL